MKYRYARLTIEGDKNTEWVCGCFVTEDGFFKFCQKHDGTLRRTILSQIDEMDMITEV